MVAPLPNTTVQFLEGREEQLSLPWRRWFQSIAALQNGAVGPEGPEGPPGAPGPAGGDELSPFDLLQLAQSGTPGPPGAAGARGPPGSDGEQGEDGSPGPPGPAGAAGATGATGLQGLPGVPFAFDGADGEDASFGPPGPQGPTGPTGATGSLGPQGVPFAFDGQDGEDAYFGPPGPQGATGPAGSSGGGGFVPPQGRLTLTSATPIMNADATAQGTIYYAEYTGNGCPVYNGSALVNLTFSNISLILDATNFLLNNVYDIFAYSASGTLTLGGGPAWTSAATVTITIATPAVISWTAHGLHEGDPVVFTTTGALPTGITAGTTYFVSSTSLSANNFDISTTVANAAAGTNVATSGTQSGTHTGTNHTTVRGTGAGTTELQLINGIWSNKNSITLHNNSSSSGSISANQATYLGSFFCTANGQTGMQFQPSAASGGSGNVMALYNAYNGVILSSMNRDSTTAFTYTGQGFEALDNSSGNRINYLDGLQNVFVDTSVNCTVRTANNGSIGCIGLVLNSSHTTPLTFNSGQPTANNRQPVACSTVSLPTLGWNYIQAVQRNTAAGGGTVTFNDDGGETLMIRAMM